MAFFQKWVFLHHTNSIIRGKTPILNRNKFAFYSDFISSKNQNKKKFQWEPFLGLLSWSLLGQTLFVLTATTAAISLALILPVGKKKTNFIVQKLLTQMASPQVHCELNGDAFPDWSSGKVSLTNLRLASAEASQSQYSFDVTIDRMDLELSLLRALNGFGIIKACLVKGIRGSFHSHSSETAVFDAKKTETDDQGNAGFYIEDFQIKDALISMHYPNFRQFNVSIISAELPRLRQNWVLLDVLSASSISGYYDDCLFTLHLPQLPFKQHFIKRIRHFRLDSLPFDQVASETNQNNPLSWIRSGSVDFNAVIQLPNEVADYLLRKENAFAVSFGEKLKRLFDFTFKKDDTKAISPSASSTAVAAPGEAKEAEKEEENNDETSTVVTKIFQFLAQEENNNEEEKREFPIPFPEIDDLLSKSFSDGTKAFRAAWTNFKYSKLIPSIQRFLSSRAPPDQAEEDSEWWDEGEKERIKSLFSNEEVAQKFSSSTSEGLMMKVDLRMRNLKTLANVPLETNVNILHRGLLDSLLSYVNSHSLLIALNGCYIDLRQVSGMLLF